jgi:hypothetical protein
MDQVETNQNCDRLVTQTEQQDNAEKPLWEILVELGQQIPAEEWEKLPKDLAQNFDHYMYGASKQK